MNAHRPELALGITLLVLLLVFCAWQAPGQNGRLTADEVNAFMQRLEGHTPATPAEEQKFLSRLRAWGDADDGRPVYMLNVMRYYEHLRHVPGAEAISATPVEANAIYENAVKFNALRLGAYPLFAGEAVGIDAPDGKHGSMTEADASVDDSDRIVVMRYPNRRAFLRLITDPAYLQVVPYKFAALQLGLVPMSAQLVVPDARWMLGGIVAILFLGFGWFRAARRGGTAG